MRKKIEKDRVVLALSTEQAEDLNWFLKRIKNIPFGDPKRSTEGIAKISVRISKTLNKQRILREFEKQGIKPSKEQIKKAMEVAK